MISNKHTPVNEFSSQLHSTLNESLQKIIESGHKPLLAAFDADGTLWDTDVGEGFFDYQIHHSGLEDLPADPWKYYLDTKKVDPVKAYVWLAQINKGISLEQVRKWAAEAVAQTKPFPLFESQKVLVKNLQKLGFEIYVVTASVKWAVEPAANLLGIDTDHVLGITTKVVNGVVTDEPIYPVTWRAGKAEALLAATGGKNPVLCSGNTLGDIALLETASHIRLAVSTQNEENGLYQEESKLREVAKQKSWLRHEFRNLNS